MQAFRPAPYFNIFQQSRYFTTSNISLFIQKWRIERGLPMNPTASGVLTDGPDYTFLDGRVSPFGEGQKKRILKQRKLKEDIICFTKEIDFATDRHIQLVQQEENRKKAILDRKLQPKGLNLLKASIKK